MGIIRTCWQAGNSIRTGYLGYGRTKQHTNSPPYFDVQIDGTTPAAPTDPASDAGAYAPSAHSLFMIEYYEFRAMNTNVVLAAEGGWEEIMRGFELVAAFIASMERRLTRFDETSELAQLNRAGGTWFSASDELYSLVHAAQTFYFQTDKLFDPSVLELLEREGYNQSLDIIRTRGAFTVPDLAPAARLDFGEVEFDADGRAIRMPSGMRVDLGGIAKGWIAENATHMLAGFSKACAVDAGGDMCMAGKPIDGGWRVALEDPRDPANTLAILRLGPGAIATSGVTKRAWQLAGIPKHHLIDPRSGHSAETDWLAVTAMAPHAAAAEVFAKALLIAGPRQANELAVRCDGLEFFAIDREGKMWGSTNAKEFLDDEHQ
jgi:FAD:protein FMN transferase